MTETGLWTLDPASARDALEGALYTPSKEVSDFAVSKLSERSWWELSSAEARHGKLAYCMREGLSDMALYHLEESLDIQGLHIEGFGGRIPLLKAAENGSNESLMGEAAKGGHRDVVALLLERGLIANEKDIFGRHAIRCAVAQEHVSLFHLLLKHGADLKKADQQDQCARKAGDAGLESMGKLLEESGVILEQ
ncbi:hypothetical protein K458DRAFT_384425 [Lentithecium fluviatile CBS 122367]|uniref:Uncharacterized protein n=1 Tax=Lentithecium fluviatile CBS 122367 TaxID=1168545 RepID=A0A6G1JHU0_9PLEO|nr:hypothetical protein K458DRAFT_384425 [Lentithecium fluviatile CBS 122367]